MTISFSSLLIDPTMTNIILFIIINIIAVIGSFFIGRIYERRKSETKK